MDNLIKVRIENFASYGLNKYRNFLSAIDKQIKLKNRSELFLFMADLLVEHACTESAIFAISYDNHMYAGIINPDALFTTKSEMLEYAEESNTIILDEELENFLDDDEELEPIIVVGIEHIDMDFFAEIDSDMRLCCYGLMIETAPGKWKIIEE